MQGDFVETEWVDQRTVIEPVADFQRDEECRENDRSGLQGRHRQIVGPLAEQRSRVCERRSRRGIGGDQPIGDGRGAKRVVQHVPVQHQPDQDQRCHDQRDSCAQRGQIGSRLDPGQRRQEQRDRQGQPVIVQHHGAAKRQGGDRAGSVNSGALARSLRHGAGGGRGQSGRQSEGHNGPPEVGLEARDLCVGHQ